eukprot:53875_1
MLVLFETPAGYALFKMSGSSKDPDELASSLSSADKVASMVKLKAFSAFEGTADAVAATTDVMEGKMGKSLKKFLTKSIVKKDLKTKLAVADAKLGGVIKEKLGVKVVSDSLVNEVMRGIRANLETLLPDVGVSGVRQMRLGLSHSLGRYKLKFSADKVDTMIVQAIGLLDELDKEINTYAMRVREWYGWHFPEMAKILNDNMVYAKCAIRMGMRDRCHECDFSDIIEDERIEKELKENAEISMGTEITDEDLLSINALAEQVVLLSEYRIQLYAYLKNRMIAIAPNLTIMVGELVGARLIAHAGSLLNLAKQPASTIQILGAEKALFRALKTKSDTPKYGLIYHASLIGQTTPKNKGKISRALAAKAALAVRMDALGEVTDTTIGVEGRSKVEARIRQLEGGSRLKETSKSSAAMSQVRKYDATMAQDAAPPAYNEAEDMVEVRKIEEVAAVESSETPIKKKRKNKDGDGAAAQVSEKKKKRKSSVPSGESTTTSGKKKKQKEKD